MPEGTNLPPASTPLAGRYQKPPRAQCRPNTNRTGWWNSTFPWCGSVADFARARSTNLPFDDLLQLGCLGLIQGDRKIVRSVKGVSPGASYAVPYITWGHCQHHLRDQHPPLRCSRHAARAPPPRPDPAAAMPAPAVAGPRLARHWRQRSAANRTLAGGPAALPRVGTAASLARCPRGPRGGSSPGPRSYHLAPKAPQTPHPCRPDSPAEIALLRTRHPRDWLRLRLGRLDP